MGRQSSYTVSNAAELKARIAAASSTIGKIDARLRAIAVGADDCGERLSAVVDDLHAVALSLIDEPPAPAEAEASAKEAAPAVIEPSPPKRSKS